MNNSPEESNQRRYDTFLSVVDELVAAAEDQIILELVSRRYYYHLTITDLEVERLMSKFNNCILNQQAAYESESN